MPQLPLTGRQSAANLAQRFGPAQLAEQHGDELSPTAESARMPFGFMFTGRCVKAGSWNELQNLQENAAYSVQGWVLLWLVGLRKLNLSETLSLLLPGGAQHSGANFDEGDLRGIELREQTSTLGVAAVGQGLAGLGPESRDTSDRTAHIGGPDATTPKAVRPPPGPGYWSAHISSLPSTQNLLSAEYRSSPRTER
jgi:hypothetical protein